MCVVFCFFFKQKTAYEMRISDWSSDVCSSDLTGDMQMKKAVIAAVLAMQAAGALSAAPAGSVSAADPGAIAEVLEFAGYKAIIETDDLGDPMIKTELGGWPTTIYFYGCDETTHQGRSEEHTSELQSLMRHSYAVFFL